MRDELKDEYNILDFQEKLLEIMVYIDRFCSDNKIDYCLMAGSALGACRHKGFIPWDDDIDIYMTESDYNKFRKVFAKRGDHTHYYLQEWGKTTFKKHNMITMAKIRLNDSQIQEKAYQGWKMHQGVFVDIFILHNCADNKIGQLYQYIWSEAVVLKGLETRGYVPKSTKDKVLLSISKLIPKNFVLKYGLQNAYKYQKMRSNFTHGFIDTRSFSRSVFPSKIMFPAIYTDFEKVKLKVPANIDAYLRIQFGEDYMILPPVGKRPINKHTSNWSVNSAKYTDFSDEDKLI
ncbi:MAG: LicD family protein [Lachnospiraceae bacterium]|nr:LicD family protein [Lachnospiraceae bacterium]